VRVLIVAVAVVGAVVLLGWMLSVEPMKRITPGLTSMNPATAACLELCCLALWAIKDGRRTGFRGLVAALAPIPVLYVGLSKLVDLSLGTALCPDSLLFASQLDYGQAFPSRMAPNVAACFVIFAIALSVLDRPGWPRFLHPQWLVTPILGLSLAGIVGYAYDTSGFYAVKHYIPMALHSAICFVLLAIAIILSRPEEGYMRVIPRGSPGARSCAMLLPACVILPALVGGLVLYGGDRGWLEGRGTGTAIAAVLTIMGMSMLAFLNSASLNRAEGVRRSAEARLQELVAELDRRNDELEREILERKLAEQRAAYQATHDSLTALPNRLLFVDRLEKAIARAMRHGDAFALMYIDIDHFKPVNDAYGHQAGDELLKELARRLEATVREVDTVARLGGDEFAAIIDAPVLEQDALRLAERLCMAVSLPYRLSVPGRTEPLDVMVGMSVGIALFPGHADDLDDLVRAADSAMYRAKVLGKSHGRSLNIEIAVVRPQAHQQTPAT
jgi:diguanylate cyclase (GGDEF)-like protein